MEWKCRCASVPYECAAKCKDIQLAAELCAQGVVEHYRTDIELIEVEVFDPGLNEWRKFDVFVEYEIRYEVTEREEEKAE